MTRTLQSTQLRRHRGFTLVELLIALVLGLAVLVGLSSVYVAVKQSFRFQETTGRLQEDASFALDTIAKDLRMAGQAGCRGIDQTTIGTNTTYYPGSVIDTLTANAIGNSNPLSQLPSAPAYITQQPLTSKNFIRGFDAGIPSSMFASSAPSNTATDSLFFSGGSSNAVSVSTPMAFATSTLILATDTFNWRNNTTRTFIVSNCASSSVFIGQVSVEGTGYKVAHDTTLNNSVDTFSSSAVFGTDTVVMPLEWSLYYVSTRTGATTPSLYRVFFNGRSRSDPEEIVSNVESMKLHYGESNAPGGVSTLQADNWRTTAGAVTDWANVVAVRIGLMMVSSEDNANPEVTLTTPNLLGAAYTLPSGASANRLRKEFSSTVVLRNRVAAR
jgi:type IV pilus assembly protein PilW